MTFSIYIFMANIWQYIFFCKGLRFEHHLIGSKGLKTFHTKSLRIPSVGLAWAIGDYWSKYGNPLRVEVVVFQLVLQYLENLFPRIIVEPEYMQAKKVSRIPPM